MLDAKRLLAEATLTSPAQRQARMNHNRESGTLTPTTNENSAPSRKDNDLDVGPDRAVSCHTRGQ